jgi:HEAT repeat protein
MACGIALAWGCYQQSPEPSPADTRQLLLMLLKDPEGSVRRTAAEALGKIGSHDATSSLVQSLRDPEPGVRAAAARSLGQLSPVEESTTLAVLNLIRDPDPHVREAAAYAVENAEFGSMLRSKLAELASHPEPAVRRTATEALRVSGGGQITGVLIALATDSDAGVRQAAVAALGDSDDHRVPAVLRDRLRHDAASEVRAEAAYRLRFATGDSALADLDTAAKIDANPTVRRWAQWTAEELRREPGSDSGLRPVQSESVSPARRSP